MAKKKIVKKAAVLKKKAIKAKAPAKRGKVVVAKAKVTKKPVKEEISLKVVNGLLRYIANDLLAINIKLDALLARKEKELVDEKENTSKSESSSTQEDDSKEEAQAQTGWTTEESREAYNRT